MEEVNKYIESGVLELYVLGELDAAERSEVEAMAARFPEVKAELEAIETALADWADSQAIAPSENVKTAFFNQIQTSEESEVLNNDITQGPAKETPKVVSMKRGGSQFYKYAFAACLALLLLSIGALFVMYQNLTESKKQIAILNLSNSSYANRVNYMDEAMKIYGNPDYQKVVLKGTENAPSSQMMVAFNPKEQKVMIDMKNMSMPETDEAHDYQLWALVDGKPVDLGVFNATDKEVVLKTMKPLENAQAFAVTLEPKGGSVAPTLEKMMVMGAI